jgi:hypothetical protein
MRSQRKTRIAQIAVTAEMRETWGRATRRHKAKLAALLDWRLTQDLFSRLDALGYEQCELAGTTNKKIQEIRENSGMKWLNPAW